MRDVGVIAFAQETAKKDRERNEVEFIIPVVQEAVRQSGMFSTVCSVLGRVVPHADAEAPELVLELTESVA